MAPSPRVDEPLSSRHKLDRPGLSHVLGDSGGVIGCVVVGTDPVPCTPRRQPSVWPAARAARPPLRSASAAIGATSTAVRAAPCRRAPRASDALAAVIARAPKAASTIAIANARGEDDAASRPLAWGITLPPPSLHRSESSPHPRRPDSMQPHSLHSSRRTAFVALAVGPSRLPSISTAPTLVREPALAADEREAGGHR